MFDGLMAINSRPPVFSRSTIVGLWTDPHISERMLSYHLDGDIDVSSYRREFIDRSVQWMTARFGLGDGSRVADFGCGPGLYTTRLARTGAVVTGIDVSPRSLRYAEDAARREGLPVTYLNQDYLTFETPDRFDLVIMIMRDYGALAPQRRRDLLSAVRHHLAPGGAFLFDVDSTASFAHRVETRAQRQPGRSQRQHGHMGAKHPLRLPQRLPRRVPGQLRNTHHPVW
jgi:SAM-dependent methyltransferase